MIRDVTWALTTGEAGMRSQALGLAAAVGLPVEEKRIALRRPWSWLPNGTLPLPLAALSHAGDGLAPPWPRLVVSCGRRSLDIALSVKRLSGGRTLAAYVQNPKLAAPRFDLVVAMPHDRVRGANVVLAETALHGVTPAGLASAREIWRERLASGDAAMLGVLLGGDNAGYRLTPAIVDRLLAILRKAAADHGTRAVITPSRRTNADARRRIAEATAAEPDATMWDGHGDNPFLGILALSERLIVTGESISMISEALATGRPVHVLPLDGRGDRHEAFLDRMAREGYVSLIEGDDLDWSFAGRGAVDSMAEPARRLRALLGLRA